MVGGLAGGLAGDRGGGELGEILGGRGVLIGEGGRVDSGLGLSLLGMVVVARERRAGGRGRQIGRAHV